MLKNVSTYMQIAPSCLHSDCYDSKPNWSHYFLTCQISMSKLSLSPISHRVQVNFTMKDQILHLNVTTGL